MIDDLLDAFGKDKKSTRGSSSGGLFGKLSRLLDSEGNDTRRTDERSRSEERGFGREDDRHRGFDFHELGEFGDDRRRRGDDNDEDEFGRGRSERRRSAFDFDE